MCECCSAVRCDDLALPSGVVVTDGSSPPYVFNSRVTLGCSDSSLVLSNPALSPTICDADGNWSTFPTCVGKLMFCGVTGNAR